MKNLLSVKNLQISSGRTVIINKVSLDIKSGEMHVIMGPNGSGKTSLILGIAGHPDYQSRGKIFINKKNIGTLSPEKRVKSGLSVTFQNPAGIPGVSVRNLLKTSVRETQPKKQLNLPDFYINLNKQANKLNIKPSLLSRGLNTDFSGGEKKLMEILCMEIIKPKFILFDEIDTGLDIDTLKIIARRITGFQKNGTGILLVTHYPRLVKLLSLSKLYVMKKGEFVASGDKYLLEQIINHGYKNL